MSTPRHRTAPGASYFVTSKCAQSHTIFQIPEIAQILIEALYHYREKGAYLLHEFVLMPDHLHLILTPSETTSLEKAMQLIKGGSSFQIHKARKQKMEIWQQGFHDWTIRDAGDWRAKAEYLAMNPVRARLASDFRDWPYSSASGKFVLDPMPAYYSHLSSGAKAHDAPTPTRGLKPPPPKERRA
jgi:REP-associated tyrosine transposase